MPLSLIGTFGVMYLLGYSLNNLSLMALTISTGFVVDDAIVMIENIARYIEEGEPPFEAALKGAKQIGFTIVSLTVSLVAVLIPLLFMGGLIGRLFREFAVTLGVAIGVSAVALAHAHADDVRAAPQAASRSRGAGGFYALVRARLRGDGRALRPRRSSGCSRTSGSRCSSRSRTVALTGFLALDRAEGLLPAAGHRAHPRRHRGRARRLVHAHDGAAARRRRRGR